MRTAVVLTLVSAVVLATAASATLDTAWLIQLRVSDTAGGHAGAIATYGCGTLTPATGDTADTIVWIGLARTSPPQIRRVDPPLPAYQFITWDLTVQAGIAYDQGSFKLAAWNPTASIADLNQDMSGPDGFSVSLYQRDALLYMFGPNENGTSTSPQFTAQYAISAGQALDGFFTLRRESLQWPEPSGICVLAGGLAGALGMAFRRRR